MKIVFSRKGFDSAAGRAPSPIIDGCPISIPIPATAMDRAETTYSDLGLGDIVERITRCRITGDERCHDDPMFENGRCAFGQNGRAQRHLDNNGVGVGDVFLFFGWFSKAVRADGHHRVFGYLKVEEVKRLGAASTPLDRPRGFSRLHPHTVGSWNCNNTIYTGPGATAVSDAPGLRLSVPTGPMSRWKVPSWLCDAGLTYHGKSTVWRPDDTLQTVGRGQEFVTEIAGRPEAEEWLQGILAMIAGGSPEAAAHE